MVGVNKMMCRKNFNKTVESEQNKAEIAESRNFAYLVVFIKLGFRQSNIVDTGTLSFLIVKINTLAVY